MFPNRMFRGLGATVAAVALLALAAAGVVGYHAGVKAGQVALLEQQKNEASVQAAQAEALRGMVFGGELFAEQMLAMSGTGLDEPRLMHISNPTDSRLGIPLVNEPIVGATTESTFYECRPQHYNPPCRKISTPSDASTPTNYLQLKAANDAALYLMPVRIGGELDDPILACANTHGASGCCRIVHTYEDSTGTVVVIECGNR